MLPLPTSRTHEEGLPPKTGILRFWDSIVQVSGRTGEDIGHSSTARYRTEESVSVTGSFTGTSRCIGRSERSEYGSRQRMRSTGRNVRGSGACLRHHTASLVSGSASYTGYVFAISPLGKSVI